MILSEQLYETACVLQGRIAESRAKAKLLVSKMKDDPSKDWESEVSALEIEMLQICAEMDELDANFSANFSEYTGQDQFSSVG